MSTQENDGVVEAGFEIPGQILRRAREARGQSLNDVVQVLKLSVKQLKALEEGRYEALPGRTFMRGFLRNYARYLNLDPQPLLDALDRPVPAKPAESAAESLKVVVPGVPVKGVDAPPVQARGDASAAATAIVVDADSAPVRVREHATRVARPVPRDDGPPVDTSSPVPALVIVIALAALAFGVGMLGWWKSAGDHDEAASAVRSETAPDYPSAAPPGAEEPLEATAGTQPVEAAVDADAVTEPGSTGEDVRTPTVAEVPEPGLTPVQELPAEPVIFVSPQPPDMPTPARGASVEASGGPAAQPVVTEEQRPAISTLEARFTASAWYEIRSADGKGFRGTRHPGKTLVTKGKLPFKLVVAKPDTVTITLDGKVIDLKPYIEKDGIARKTLP